MKKIFFTLSLFLFVNSIVLAVDKKVLSNDTSHFSIDLIDPYITSGDFEKRLSDLSESTSATNRRFSYFVLNGMLNYADIATNNFEKENDITNKRMLALIGYRMYPQSRIWKSRLLKYFPRTEKDIRETFCSYEGNFMYDQEQNYFEFLGNIAVTQSDSEVLYIILEDYDQLSNSAEIIDIVGGLLFDISNKSPKLFLRTLKKLPNYKQGSILVNFVYGPDSPGISFVCPFTKELERLVKTKDKELSSYAAVVLKKIQNIVQEHEKEEKKNK